MEGNQSVRFNRELEKVGTKEHTWVQHILMIVATFVIVKQVMFMVLRIWGYYGNAADVFHEDLRQSFRIQTS